VKFRAEKFAANQEQRKSQEKLKTGTQTGKKASGIKWVNYCVTHYPHTHTDTHKHIHTLGFNVICIFFHCLAKWANAEFIPFFYLI